MIDFVARRPPERILDIGRRINSLNVAYNERRDPLTLTPSPPTGAKPK